MPSPLRVLVWNEGVHERSDAAVQAVYPDGIHGAIRAGLAELLPPDSEIRTATLDDPEHGLAETDLADIDVVIWWGHIAHDRVDDAVVDRVQARVLGGMGLIVLHSAHHSKIFRRLMGTSCSLIWREDGQRELVWTVAREHPIAEGVPHPLVIPEQEMYGEHFDIPTPDELVFVSSFAGGEVIRSGTTFRRGHGRVFCFTPGHETHPVFHHPDVRRVLANAVRWAAPVRPITGPDIPQNAPVGWFDSRG